MERVWKVPTGLGKYGTRLFKELGPSLLKSGNLKAVDRPAFELMCICYDQMRDAHDLMHKEGLVIQDQRKSVKKNPLFMVWKDSLNGYLRLSEEFGLSPKSRSEKIRFGKEKEKNQDDKYFAD